MLEVKFGQNLQQTDINNEGSAALSLMTKTSKCTASSYRNRKTSYVRVHMRG